ncbi:MAG: hypothetical protein J6M12_06215 [Clostridia bacterium]|nr:hypothetical protein [Clostridia bacterium]
MTVDEFIVWRDVKIKDDDHKRIVRMFYPYLQSVSGDKYLLPSILGKLLGIDLADAFVTTGCFNGVNDDTPAPYGDVDFYVKLSNGIKVFVFGKRPMDSVTLKENEFVILVNSDTITDHVVRKENHIIVF